MSTLRNLEGFHKNVIKKAIKEIKSDKRFTDIIRFYGGSAYRAVIHHYLMLLWNEEPGIYVQLYGCPSFKKYGDYGEFETMDLDEFIYATIDSDRAVDWPDEIRDLITEIENKTNTKLNEANKYFFGTENTNEVKKLFENTTNMEERASRYLDNIVNKCKHKPNILDDYTFNYEVCDDFEWWQNDFGEYDDTYQYLERYMEDGKAVAGWKTETSFKDTEKLLPKKIKELIKKGKYSNPYKRDPNKFEVWTTNDLGLDINILRFMQFRSDNGRYYAEYWYVIAIDGY